MKEYIIYITTAMVLVLAFETYRLLSGEALTTFLLVSYANSIGLSTLFVNIGKIITLDVKIRHMDEQNLKGFITLGKDYGRLESKLEKVEKHIRDEEKYKN